MQNLDINNGQAISNATSRDTKNIKEDIHRIFHQSGLWITIEANNKTIKFLGITFNLNKSTYQPFIKANIMLQYIYRDSNHLSITTENIPTSINKWLSYLSSHKESWLSHLSIPKSTWWMRIPDTKPSITNKHKHRKRDNILWYNSPFSKKCQHQYQTQIPCLTRINF